MEITLNQLKDICDAPDSAEAYIEPLNRYMAQREVNTRYRIAGFLGQLAHECMGFKVFQEESSGKQYEGRRDLGNIHPGDGEKYKGRGPIQITGYNEYKNTSMFLFGDARLLNEPELLLEPEWGAASAVWYWWQAGLNAVMDVAEKDPTHIWTVRVNGKPTVIGTTYQWVTEKINGGQNGYLQRLSFYKKALEVLSEETIAIPAPVKK